VTDQITIKPCPFCGREPEVLAVGRRDHIVACGSGHKQCSVRPVANPAGGKVEAIKAWNRRASC